MYGQLMATIHAFRDLIHVAEPPYTKPHEYMNVMRPLTPLRYECRPGATAPRIGALRHALYLLNQAEQQLVLSDKVPNDQEFGSNRQEKVQKDTLCTIGCVGGILWLHGIDSSLGGVQEAA